MQDRQQWMELCRQASVEQDPKKLLEPLKSFVS
jgi:hypothetical protein